MNPCEKRKYMTPATDGDLKRIADEYVGCLYVIRDCETGLQLRDENGIRVWTSMEEVKRDALQLCATTRKCCDIGIVRVPK